MEIYLDVVFAVNFFMDALIFYTASKLMRKKVKKRRILLGSLISAAVYCVYIAVPPLSRVNGILAGSLMLSAGIAASLGKEGFLRSFLLVNISAFAIGGILLGVFYISGTYGIFGKNLSFGIGNYPLWLLVTLSSAIYIAVRLFGGRLAAETTESARYADIKAYIGEKSFSAKALIDTGNLLSDPITGEDVIIVEIGLLIPFLDTEKLLSESISFEKALSIFNQPVKGRLKAVPFKSLGTKCGIMPAFRADKIINERTGTEIENSLIGVYGGSLSNDSSYNAILSPKCIKGG